ncbi:hypothetical protein ACFU5M_31680, partial [Nocardia sp. NPDC057455]
LGAGRWPGIDDDADHVFGDREVWRDMAYETRPTLVGDIAIGYAVSDDRKWITFAAAQRTSTGRIHLEVGYHEAPTPAAADRLIALVLRLDPCALVARAAPAPAATLRTPLLAASLEPEELTGPQYVEACGGMYDDAVNGLLSHSDDPRMNAAVDGAFSKLPGAVWQARTGGVISPLEAATCARQGLLIYGGLIGAPLGPAGDETYQDDDEFSVFDAAF